MIEIEKIHQLIEDFLSDKKDLFLVLVKVSKKNQMEVIIDSFTGIKISNCINLSRHIESNLNRDEEDFSLKVSSAGLGEPLKVFKQYKKNIGKQVEVMLQDGSTRIGLILEVNDNNGILLEVEEKKKKEIFRKQYNFNFEQIKQTKNIISF